MKALQLTEATVIQRMKRLASNEDFLVLKSMWLTKGRSIIEEGKKLRRPEDWARVQGFDEAATMADKWASRVLKQKTQGPMPLED